MADFTEIVATAISNAEAHAELTASRARVIAAADEARRRIERDLHDGAQQRLAAVVLKLQMTQNALPVELVELHAELDAATNELVAAVDELRDYARGIPPAVLTTKGLGPALKAPARRSVVPVELDIRVSHRLPARAETGAFSEALMNAGKHANASVVTVEVALTNHFLRVSVRDDGVGGAELGHGSGPIGLQDRVAALGGRMSLRSPAGSERTYRLSFRFPVRRAYLSRHDAAVPARPCQVHVDAEIRPGHQPRTSRDISHRSESPSAEPGVGA